MKIKLALFCLGLAATATAADAPQASSPQPQPLAPSATIKGVNGSAPTKPVGIHRVPSPTISETRVTRRADGSLAMNCVQKPNPKLRQQMAAQQAAARSMEPKQP